MSHSDTMQQMLQPLRQHEIRQRKHYERNLANVEKPCQCRRHGQWRGGLRPYPKVWAAVLFSLCL